MNTCGTRAAIVCLISLSIFAWALAAQRPASTGKPTELVVSEYLKLVADGALLTPQGWNKAGSLFVVSTPYVKDAEIHLMSVGVVGEMWAKDGRAMVETKWTDDFGTIDSLLRYRPPPEPRPTMTVFLFNLELTDKRWEIGGTGELKREVIGPHEWKIATPMRAESTLDKAIANVSARAADTRDPQIKKNAEKTVAALRRLYPACGNVSAC